jgi:hypothetical protein
VTGGSRTEGWWWTLGYVQNRRSELGGLGDGEVERVGI